ncbi:hypothetical protein LEP1GSC137_3405 [Leptospira borgpetersenii str. Noumea 25]|nr:hypothetical protein LEP1GSC121_4219 [Leptospira borgpetersenii serovar Castellonis str. 200801910]EMO11250.1 hypothetical protein LEP1GSC137_3405 [Leptospira borgpetersenii str. Noumea 25]
MVIYGLSSRFYCSCTLVGVSYDSKVLGQVLIWRPHPEQ